MTCPHENTTLAWLYGEGPEDHAHHVAACEACTSLADDVLDVAHAVAPIAPALRSTSPPPELPMPANDPRPLWTLRALGGAGALVAAAAILLALTPPVAPPTAPSDDAIAALAPTPLSLTADALDLRLDALEGEVADLSLDFGPL